MGRINNLLIKYILPTGLLCSVAIKPMVAKPFYAYERFGDFWKIAVPVSAAMISNYKHDYDGVIQLYTNVLVTQLVTNNIKYATKHTAWGTRPNGNKNSFPSGHASAAFSGAAYLYYRYGLEYAALPYLIAAGVGASRVHNDKHHVRDVVAAALLSQGIAYVSNKYWPVVFNKDPNKQRISVHGTGESGIGIKIAWRY